MTHCAIDRPRDSVSHTGSIIADWNRTDLVLDRHMTPGPQTDIAHPKPPQHHYNNDFLGAALCYYGHDKNIYWSGLYNHL